MEALQEADTPNGQGNTEDIAETKQDIQTAMKMEGKTSENSTTKKQKSCSDVYPRGKRKVCQVNSNYTNPHSMEDYAHNLYAQTVDVGSGIQIANLRRMFATKIGKKRSPQFNNFSAGLTKENGRARLPRVYIGKSGRRTTGCEHAGPSSRG